MSLWLKYKGTAKTWRVVMLKIYNHTSGPKTAEYATLVIPQP